MSKKVFFIIFLLIILISETNAQSYIYWKNNMSIGRANLDGSNPKDQFVTPVNYGWSITADKNYLYYQWGRNYIARANLDGTNPSNKWIRSFTSFGVAVDKNYFYWINHYGNGNSEIGRANLDGTNPNKFWIIPSYGKSATGLALDENYIYWTNGQIARASLDGSGINENWITGCEGTTSIAVDKNYIYCSRRNIHSIRELFKI